MQTNHFLQGSKEFHISKKARDFYQFDAELFSFNGNVIFANFHAARVFAQKINQKRDLVNFPEQAIQAGQINAMGLVDEILHLVINEYQKQIDPHTMATALAWLEERYGEDTVTNALENFVTEFPPTPVYQGQLSVDEYLASSSQGISRRQIALEELLLLWVMNANPACIPYLELFDDTNLEKFTSYPQLITGLKEFFDEQPFFGPDNQNLIDMLRSPAIAVPHSLPGQLEYIRTHWGYLLGRHLYRLLSSLDLIQEEGKAIFAGPGPAYIYEFGALGAEPQRFSPDKDWMPNLVLIAKNAYVWLDQLSKKYQRPIHHLDQIPDEELDRLSRWGISGLWLIGLWERSAASQQIKVLCGNPDAVASAYSLFDYEIASDLGGEESYRNLQARAWQRGIRLASDMVPNHMGIDSKWVIEHPDWFISSEYSPFPSYTFNGPNLSWNERVGIYLEDHYYDSSDAAVVFKRVDNWTGDVRYIYHGNDGTSMPWNDTAQLNYLKPEVREAVIQTILNVARKFPIIRFDAAMTLAKKHFQRLWYPEPGSGGDIPSRAEYGMTKEQFDAAMPVEFWREVVDRVAQEVPDTLLLAEAFWLMEGYFVRTLGMHRVYNSAFMNMLRAEKNQEYRLVIKNTLEFDPEILQRYVNFMNNPDERTAVEQFGKGDKYFGICTLMATMPGLPMFGHGQVEGLTEKYGMEYRRAYWDEQPDQYLIERHEREIFPLLHRRYLFAEARNFRLFDFYTTDGFVNEDVFAYSNRSGEDRALIIYHNRYASTSGWVRISTPYPVQQDGQGERVVIQQSLGEALGLRYDASYFTIFRDHISGLEYIHNNLDLSERGLYLELQAYSARVFLDFRQVPDNQWRQYAQLTSYLNGRGVPSIDEALIEILLQPIHKPFAELVNAGQFQWLIDNRVIEEITSELPERESQTHKIADNVTEEVERKVTSLLEAIKTYTASDGNQEESVQEIMSALRTALLLNAIKNQHQSLFGRDHSDGWEFLYSGHRLGVKLTNGDAQVWGTLLGWLCTYRLGAAAGAQEREIPAISRSWIDEWKLGTYLANALQGLGLNEDDSWLAVGIIRFLINHQSWYTGYQKEGLSVYQLLESWFRDTDIQKFLVINRHQGILYFNKEAFGDLLWWMFLIALIEALSQPQQHPQGKEIEMQIARCYELIQKLKQAEENSEYQVEKLFAALD